MVEGNKFAVGGFVTLGAILLLVCLFLLGVADRFERKIYIYTLFDESVQGLAPGSEVKYRGIKFGAVSEIIPSEGRAIKVIIELDNSLLPEEIKKAKTHEERIALFNQVLKKDKNKDVACSLQYLGITGMKYIELEHYGPNTKIFKVDNQPANYIPSKGSILANAGENINTLLSKLAKLDIDQLMQRSIKAIESLEKRLNDPKIDAILVNADLSMKQLNTTIKTISSEFATVSTKLQNSLAKVDKISVGIEKEINGIQLKETMVEIKGSFKDLQGTSKKLNGVIDTVDEALKGFNKLGENVNQTLEGKTKTGKAVTQSAESFNDVSKSLQETLQNLDRMIITFENLVNAIEEDPSSVIFGKTKHNK